MHFISLITLSLVAVANGAALKEEATPGNGNNLVPAQVCKVGYNYCGWYLADGLGEYFHSFSGCACFALT